MQNDDMESPKKYQASLLTISELEQAAENIREIQARPGFPPRSMPVELQRLLRQNLEVILQWYRQVNGPEYLEKVRALKRPVWRAEYAERIKEQENRDVREYDRDGRDRRAEQGLPADERHRDVAQQSYLRNSAPTRRNKKPSQMAPEERQEYLRQQARDRKAKFNARKAAEERAALREAEVRAGLTEAEIEAFLAEINATDTGTPAT